MDERIRTMATTGSSGTFAQWLSDQAKRGSQDPIGWLAAAWDSFAGSDRPKLSAPTSIKKFLAEHGSQEQAWQEGLSEAVDAAIRAYTTYKQGQADPGLAAALQGVTEADLATDAHPGPAMSVPLPDGISAADAQYLAHQLDQLQAQLGLLMQMLAVSSPAAAEVLLRNLGDEPETPIHTLDDLIGQQVTVQLPTATEAGYSAGQAMAREIAARNGWVPPTEVTQTWAQWYGMAEREPDAGHPPQSHG